MNSELIQLIAEIDEFKGYWKGMRALPNNRLHALKELATIESIGSSTRIEGAELNNGEVDALLKNIDVRSFQTRDEQEVAGYAKAMELIQESYADIELTENNIKYLHKVLLQFSEKDHWHLGEYKKNPNHVAAYDRDGNQLGIIFEAASPFETPMRMTALIDRTRRLATDGKLHPLLVIADFIVRFLAIHPFQDGNGRLSRILANLLLLQRGYAFVMYSSHERIVEANKDEYYQGLRAAQTSMGDDEKISTVWAGFFLEMLKKQKDELFRKIKREQRVFTLPALSEQIMDLAKQHGRVSVAFLTKTSGANRNTVKKHLQTLTRRNLLFKKGKGRGSYYTPF